MAQSNPQTVCLKCADGRFINVPAQILEKYTALKVCSSQLGEPNYLITLKQATSKNLNFFLKWSELKELESETSDQDIAEMLQSLTDDQSVDTLVGIHSIGCDELYQELCKLIAHRLETKTVEECRRDFHIKYPPSEEDLNLMKQAEELIKKANKNKFNPLFPSDNN